MGLIVGQVSVKPLTLVDLRRLLTEQKVEKLEAEVVALLDPITFMPLGFACMKIAGDDGVTVYRCDQLLEQLGVFEKDDKACVFVLLQEDAVSLNYRNPQIPSDRDLEIAGVRLPETDWQERVLTYLDRRTPEEKALQVLFYKTVEEEYLARFLELFLADTKNGCVTKLRATTEFDFLDSTYVTGLWRELQYLGLVVKDCRGFILTEKGKDVLKILQRVDVLLEWLTKDENRGSFFVFFDDLRYGDCNESVSVDRVASKLKLSLEFTGNLMLDLCKHEIVFFAPEGQPEPGFTLFPVGKALWHALNVD